MVKIDSRYYQMLQDRIGELSTYDLCISTSRAYKQALLAGKSIVSKAFKYYKEQEDILAILHIMISNIDTKINNTQDEHSKEMLNKIKMILIYYRNIELVKEQQRVSNDK